MAKKNTYRWLDREMCASGPYWVLVFNEDEFVRVHKGLGKRTDVSTWISDKAYGTVTELVNDKTGAQVCVVSVDAKRLFEEDRPITQVYALLVHEAVHVFQKYCNKIGEHEPGREFEAHCIQFLSLKLFEEYDRRVRAAKEST